MPFQLVIASGTEAGREFVFDQPSIVIGRTDECDVILYETGVSRRHARVFEENGQHFVEDLGSSNGTHVNEARIGLHPLKPGDSIRLGTISFTFSPTISPELGDGTDPATRLVPLGELRRSRNKGVALLPKDQSTEQLRQLARSDTSVLTPVTADPKQAPRPAGARRALSAPGKSQQSLPPAAPPPDEAHIDEPPTDADLPSAPRLEAAASQPPLPVPLREAQEISGPLEALSASERMRQKRLRRSALARWWKHAEPVQKFLAGLSIAVMAVGLAVLAAVSVKQAVSPGPSGAEPNVIGPQPAPDSFGLGEGVTWVQTDKKDFQFVLDNTSKRVALVHYQSLDISAAEVSLTLNGGINHLLEADLADSSTQEHEVVFDPDELQPGKVNIVTFDNLKNPPKAETWRVWNVWLELIPLPDLSADLLIAEAEAKYKLGVQKLEQRAIYIGNLWQGYSALRDAWLYLEAVPEGSKLPTYEVIRAQMRDARKVLDDKCTQLLGQAKGEHARNDFRSFDATMAYISDVFPSRLHPCPSKAEYLRYQLENE
jgi:pSer/pThr/pTyr-binding forkhead associated (FHA) protein